jgi:hypothetical protein
MVTNVGDRSLETAFFILVFSVYVKTLFPSIPGGDSGELIAEACHLGTAHPPGYPLFTLVLHVVTKWLPSYGTEAWRANVFSAGCGAGSAAFIMSSVNVWAGSETVGPWAGMAAGGLYAFSPLVWMYSTGSEVFAANNFAASGIVYVTLRYARRPSWYDVKLGAFFCGIALCNQHTIVLFEVPLILWILWTQLPVITLKKLCILGTLFLCGMLPYAYMPIAATYNPQHGAWGEVRSLSGFFHHFRRGDYGTFRLFASSKDAEGLTQRLVYYATDLLDNEASLIGIALGVIGMLITLHPRFVASTPAPASANDNSTKTSRTDAKATKKSRSGMKPPDGSESAVVTTKSIGWGIALTYVFYLIVFHTLANIPLNEGLLFGVQMRFWMQPNIIFFIWIGVGLSTCLKRIGGMLPARSLSILAPVVSVLIISAQINKWYAISDQHDNKYIHNYAKALMAPLPEKSLFFTNYDQQWTSIRYLQRCENYR